MNTKRFCLNRYGKALRAFLSVVFAGMFAISAANTAFAQTAGEPGQVRKPGAEFKDVWVDYDVTESGQKGMRIHVKFTALAMKGLDSYLAIYFETAAGDRLRDKNGKFNSTSGEVAVYRELKPAYDPAEYADYSIFMPYDELDLSAGDWKLRMDIDLIYKAGGLIQHLTYKEFQYTSAEKQESPNKIWIEYNQTRNGRRGMLVHVNFEVTGLKGVDAKMIVRIKDSGDEFLASSSAGFSNADGDFEVSYDIKPGYDPAVYEDVTVFIPYDEIRIGKGNWSLKLDVDIAYESGELIKHIDYKEFEFSRP
ncbi:MAG TPA: hypothetical protein PKM58_06250 [Pyrinomonadaceae bacterium]|nr:hypothetical protein [Pyrinomonadaceae bacterium]